MLKKLASLLTLAGGIVVMEIGNHFFDMILYPAVLIWLGILKGMVLLTFLSIIFNYLSVHAYRILGINGVMDSLYVLAAKSTLSGKITKFILRSGYWPTVVFLSWEDPTKAFIYVRRGVSKHFTQKDWFTFAWIHFLANVLHTLLVGGAIVGVRAVIN